MLMQYARLTIVVIMTFIGGSGHALADTARAIDSGVERALSRFYTHVGGARELVRKARGVLVFPAVVKAGIGVGGEYGEGALMIDGQWGGYFSTVSASIGFQLGVEQRTVIIAFMTDEALTNFRRTRGWKVGVDGSVAIITVGIGASVDTNKLTNPVVGFILDPKGLMYNLTLEGSKITQISR